MQGNAKKKYFFWLESAKLASPTGTVSKEWSCLSMGWTAQNWSVQGKYASSSSLKRCCSYWMWKTQSSTWTSLFWAFSSSSFGWPPTLSSATKSRQSDRFLTGLLVLFNVIPGQVCLLLLFHFILCRGAKRTEHIASSVQSCYKSTFTCFTS